MSLQVWLPLNGDLHNQGLAKVNVTVSGTTTFNTDGKIGQSLTCNGSSFWTITPVAVGASASICCWAKTSTNGKMPWVIVATSSTKLNLYASTIYSLNTGDGNNNPFVNASGNNISVFTDNLWHHFVVTFNGASAKLYIDGIYKGTAKTYKSPTTTSANIVYLGGGYSGGHTYDWNGSINDFRIYNHVLSDKEIEEISKGLVLHYRLDNNGLGNPNLALHTRDLSVVSSKDNLNMFVRGSVTRQLRPDGFYESKGTASWRGLSFWANQLNLTVGTKVTYSFYIYTNGSSRAFSFYPMMYNSAGTRDTSTGLPISIDGGPYTTVNAKAFPNTTATTPEYHYVTFEWNQAVANIISNGGSIELSIQVHGNWASGDWASVFAPKVEFGDKPTPWCPHPSELLFDNNIIYDSSGYNNNGIIVGNPKADNNFIKYNNSIYFPGNGNLIKLTPFYFNTEDWTVSFWYYHPLAVSSTWNSFICLSKDTGTDANKKFALMFNNGSTNHLWCKANSGSARVFPIKVNTWTYLTLTSEGKVYENGVLKASSINPGANMTGTYDLVIGSRAASASINTTSTQYTGNMSDIRIYTTALTAAQIKELYMTSMSIDGTNVVPRDLE